MLWVTPAHAVTPSQWLSARLDAIAPVTAPAFIASYDVQPGKEIFDTANVHTAYTYDQALAIMAFLAVNDVAHARRIGDAVVYAQDHDRLWHDGRLRNAYAAGLIIDAPVKLPGYWDAKTAKWIEDSYADGSATGNNAWMGVALMRLSLASGDRKYAEAARGIGRWLIDVVGSDGGFRGGFEGFDQSVETLTWRSTEHNTAALALMRLLDRAYPGQGFGAAAGQAEHFIQSMWTGARFEVGTMPDGKTVNTGYSGLDAQVLSLLALYPAKPEQYAALDYTNRVHGVPGGFDYSDARKGIWAEGTMEAATLYRVLGQTGAADKLISGREADQGPEGGLYAIQGLDGHDIETLSTGLKQGNGEGLAWSYYRRIHVAPTAWAIMAKAGYNPLARP